MVLGLYFWLIETKILYLYRLELCFVCGMLPNLSLFCACNVFMIYAINNLEAKFYVKGFDVLRSMFLQENREIKFWRNENFWKKKRKKLTNWNQKILNFDYYVISITALIKISYWSLMHWTRSCRYMRMWGLDGDGELNGMI